MATKQVHLLLCLRVHLHLKHAKAQSPPPLPATARALPSSVLNLHLDRYQLSHAGSRATRAERLWDHTHPLCSGNSPDITPPPESEDQVNDTSHSSVSSESDNSDNDSIPYCSDSDMLFMLATTTPPARHHHRHRHSRSEPWSRRQSSYREVSTTSSSSPSDESDLSRSRSLADSTSHGITRATSTVTTTTCKHSHHNHKRSHRHHFSGTTSPISKSLQRKIVRGEFIEFTELLGELTVAGALAPTLAPIGVALLLSSPSSHEVLSSVSPRIAQQLWCYQ